MRKNSEFYKALTTLIDKSRIFDDPLHTIAWGTDASLYRLIPWMVVKPACEEEVSFILGKASEFRVPVTFRAAGTSLSGQAVTDSVIILISGNDWNNFRINEDKTKITVQPALIGARINTMLERYGRKIGPDPASIDAATIGGIVANNASGLRSRSAGTSYSTVEDMKIILADGTVLDTGNQESRKVFITSHKKMIDDILFLAQSVKENKKLAERIRTKYRLKNTTGYSLNALTDFSDPFDIIKHLIIGSEGTLGFISEITLFTVPVKPFRASTLIIFPDISEASKAITLLSGIEVEAVEFIDRQGLKSVENEPGMPGYLKNVSRSASALLIETSAYSKQELNEQIEEISGILSGTITEVPGYFTDIPAEYDKLWKVRKGLFPSAGAMREKGTSVIIEDIAVPVERFGEAVSDIRNILEKYNLNNSVIYGHALEGNLHFVISRDFKNEKETGEYGNMMNDVAELVVHKYDGSLKAEHGTGRNMAPFVRMEWGDEAYEVMKRIKNIFDPYNVLNPGVILNDDPEIHLKNLKVIPVVDDTIDKCIECGFCEPFCVSGGFTLTPRQRIVVCREISKIKESGFRHNELHKLVKSFKYEGNTTCATDGLCSSNCPVNIDTGLFIKKLRSEKSNSVKKRAMFVARNIHHITAMMRTFLTVVSFLHNILGSRLMKFFATGIRKLSGNFIPQWNPFLPRGAKKIKNITRSGKDTGNRVVYFPSCINRSMGVSADYRHERQLSEEMILLMEKAGFEVILPDNLNKLCCGMAFMSKGFIEAGAMKSGELENALLEASRNGEYPVVCEMSPCLYTMKENMRNKLKLYEPVGFIMEYLLPSLEIVPVKETVTVFPVCTMKKMELDKKLIELAKLCASEVIVPETNCCGFSGDKGFFNPELNRYALRNLREQIPDTVIHGYSTSRTCEIGLSLNSGISYKSIVYLVNMATRPKNFKSF
ncbi:MAG TPA: FAD-binding and (Fe-S)-binding domain-containing protein [Bacteroidales bacterium]|nr:FAD-binding oxidoreductase [Bacteroidales bacterium]HOU95730.1 FAD-binding and (Fe-S)-binding domain-containing protein [Bacteroidales bacterium]HQG36714.1 FAD-binding and (Fe-S)-binding domain-containing protein [Bacteroidales bacterium]HQG52882.1 FAD-binding and (Fe-S)-binding domain-containing protein [Bacteroidales bacterium]HQJ20201.1 FAD-binding and (Fe-S)-binding domain-containing protein [Bacteroidales bacterium]